MISLLASPCFSEVVVVVVVEVVVVVAGVVVVVGVVVDVVWTVDFSPFSVSIDVSFFDWGLPPHCSIPSKSSFS